MSEFDKEGIPMKIPKEYVSGSYKTKILKFLGEAKSGFTYYLAADRYVYQKFPEDEYWHNGHNRAGDWNGWVCSAPVWDRTFYKLVEENNG